MSNSGANRRSTLVLGAALTVAVLVGATGTAWADTSTPVPPPTKADSPGTNLQDYPKLPVSPTTAPVGSAAPSVIAVVQLSNGDVQETIFDTAPGLTAEQHYQQLQQAGVVGLRDPNMAEAGPAVVAPCASGTARLECSNGHTLHWANNGYGHPQVYFVDHTGSAWPTDVSTYTWNQAQGIDSIYVWGSCPGYGGTHCVNVNDANYGNTGKWAGTTGLTYLTWNPTSYNFVDGKVYIQLNDYNFGLNAAGHRQDVCQEQGHSLGMDHNTATNSCMYQYIINSTGAETPDSADFSLIAELYSVSH